MPCDHLCHRRARGVPPPNPSRRRAETSRYPPGVRTWCRGRDERRRPCRPRLVCATDPPASVRPTRWCVRWARCPRAGAAPRNTRTTRPEAPAQSSMNSWQILMNSWQILGAPPRRPVTFGRPVSSERYDTENPYRTLAPKASRPAGRRPLSDSQTAPRRSSRAIQRGGTAPASAGCQCRARNHGRASVTDAAGRRARTGRVLDRAPNRLLMVC